MTNVSGCHSQGPTIWRPPPPHSLAPPSQFKLMGGLGETAQLGETTQISNHTY